MTLAQLAVLIAIVDAGSLTAAGRALGLSQSGVSHALSALESELGVTLLERDRGGIRLTEVGERIVIQARASLRHAEQVRHEARATLALMAGTLRVGTLTSVANRLLPGLIRRFAERSPGVTLELREGTDAEVRAWLRGYEIDIGVVTLPAAGLVTARLLADAMLAVLPADHRLSNAGAITVADLTDEPFIMSAGGCEPLIRSIFQTVGATPRVRYTIREMGTLLAMVEAGLGVTLVPALALPPALPGARILALTPPVERHLALGLRAITSTAPAVAAFIAEAQALARELDEVISLKA